MKRRRPTSLTPSQLAELACECMARAEEIREPVRLEEDAREAITAFLQERPQLEQVVGSREFVQSELARGREQWVARMAVCKLLIRLLDAPEVLRRLVEAPLAARGDNVRHWAIYLMMDRLLHHSEWTDNSRTSVVFPYRKKLAAAGGVVKGFNAAGLYTRLTKGNVVKIYNRHFAKH